MPRGRTHYQVLGVARDASSIEIANAVRDKLAELKEKPGSSAAEQDVREAYRVLANPDLRADYDEQLPPDPARLAAQRAAEKGPGAMDNVKDLVRPGTERIVWRGLQHAVHLLVGLTDVSLGVAGLALNPGSPQRLYDTLKDPKAPMTFENYSTLFLMYWLLGALLLLCMIPQRSARRSIQMFGWPGTIAFAVASLASVALFCLGCWKIDYARRHHTPWRPMLSYWIGGASAISFPMCGVEVFHTFGVVGLVFMLIHTFN